jgi:multidrug efflux pump subunit AcrB
MDEVVLTAGGSARRAGTDQGRQRPRFPQLRRTAPPRPVKFERDLTPRLQQVADARSLRQPEQRRSGSGSGRAISVMLSGSDPDLLQRTAQTLVEQMSGLRQVVAPRISAICAVPKSSSPRISISPRRWASPPRP